MLNVKGEDLYNVRGAKDIVSWYNSHPQYVNYDINFRDIKNIVFIGNGNVAIDVARVLTSKNLQKTDIFDKAFEIIN